MRPRPGTAMSIATRPFLNDIETRIKITFAKQ